MDMEGTVELNLVVDDKDNLWWFGRCHWYSEDLIRGEIRCFTTQDIVSVHQKLQKQDVVKFRLVKSKSKSQQAKFCAKDIQIICTERPDRAEHQTPIWPTLDIREPVWCYAVFPVPCVNLLQRCFLD